MAHYNLIFQGKIVDGASLDEVKNNVARLFKADAAKTEALFSGKSIVIKKNLDSESTKKYLAIMKKAGAIIRAVKLEEDTASITSSPGTTQSDTSSNAPATEQKTATSNSLSAGLASLTNYNNPKQASEAPAPAPAPAPENAINSSNDGLQLAPVGSDILAPSTKDEAVEIPDISHLTMSEAETGSLEEFAQHIEAIDLPDIDSLTMSEANTGSMEEFAIKADPMELPDISELDMAEQDNTPLSTGTAKATPVEIPDTSNLTMSEAQEGTLEGIEKKPEPVDIPDISHIKTELQDEKEDKDDSKKGNITGKATFQIN